MGSHEIRSAIEQAIGYLTDHPDEARYTDSAAVATLEDGLRCVVTGPDGVSAATDMPASVGGGGSAPSPGWLFRAAIASCMATFIGMRAAQLDIDVSGLEVTVDSESDDRGVLGIDESIPARPLALRMSVRATSPDQGRLRELAEWALLHCPVSEAAARAVPVSLEVGTR